MCREVDDRARHCQRPVISRELPRRLKHDRTCQVEHNQTQHLSLVLHHLPCVRAMPTPLCQCTLEMTEHGSCVSGKSSRQQPVIKLRPHALYCHLIGCTGPAKASVRSFIVTPSRLHFFTELIHINSNFSFANVPTPPCVCVLAFHKHFPKD